MTGKDIVDGYLSGWGSTSMVRRGKNFIDHVPKSLQNEVEIVKFLDVVVDVLGSARDGGAVEIGLHHGATHLMWKRLFAKVVSVELDMALAAMFAGGIEDACGSVVVCSDSGLPETRVIVDEVLGGKADLLFIDGDHTFKGVERDYENYESVVRSGGIIAFHDYLWSEDIRRFVDMLKCGSVKCFAKDGFFGSILVEFGIVYYVKG